MLNDRKSWRYHLGSADASLCERDGGRCAPADVVMSPPFSGYFVASPVPSIQTGDF